MNTPIMDSPQKAGLFQEIIRVTQHWFSPEMSKYWIQKWHWTAFVVITAFILFVETIEHLFRGSVINTYYILEVVLVLLLIVIAECLIQSLIVALVDRSRINQILKYKNNLYRQLAAATDFDEIAAEIDGFASSIVPEAVSVLYVRDNGGNELVRYFNNANAARLISPPETLHLPENLTSLSRSIEGKVITSGECANAPAYSFNGLEYRYCLPLPSNKSLIGMLHFYLPAGMEFNQSQTEIFEQVLPEVAGSVLALIGKKARDEHAVEQALNKMHQRMAHELQETFGKNMTQLQVMLNQLKNEHDLTMPEVQREINQMSDLADTSFDLFQKSLPALTYGQAGNLEELLSSHARLVAQRAGFELDFSTKGAPKPLSARINRHIYLIFREAFDNIEAHSKATRVRVSIEWEGNHLSVMITDNGCGFNNADIHNERHFGLRFMQKHAERIQASFNCRSAPNKGTSISILRSIDE